MALIQNNASLAPLALKKRQYDDCRFKMLLAELLSLVGGGDRTPPTSFINYIDLMFFEFHDFFLGALLAKPIVTLSMLE